MPTSRRTFLAAAGTTLGVTAATSSPAVAAPRPDGAPGVGHRWPSELVVRKDPVTGATIRQLTDYRAHSNHAYLPQ